MVIKTGSVADYRPILNVSPASSIPEIEKIRPVAPTEKVQPPKPRAQDSEDSNTFRFSLVEQKDPSRPPAFNLAKPLSEKPSEEPAEETDEAKKSEQSDGGKPDSESKKASGPGRELSQAEQEQVNRLRARDAEVAAHENAHVAAAGPYARGGANYSYQTGPDGKRYRVGGHVNIDISEERDPRATIQKAQVIYRAALAPAEPSNQDRSVASAAKQMEARAREQLANEEKSNSMSNTKQALDAYEKTSKAKAQFTSGFSLAA